MHPCIHASILPFSHPPILPFSPSITAFRTASDLFCETHNNTALTKFPLPRQPPSCSPQLFDGPCARVLGYPLRLRRRFRREPRVSVQRGRERCTARLSVRNLSTIDLQQRFVRLLVVVVIGSGPAAHTAAVYLGRAELKRELVVGCWLLVVVLPLSPKLTTRFR